MNRRSTRLGFVCALAAGLGGSAHGAPRDRAAFAEAMSQIEPGTPAAVVEALLGKPDDVRTERDPGGLTTERTREIWCYGTRGHLTFPSRGWVYIGLDGKAQYVFGGRGRPPAPSLIPEEELVRLLRLIDRAPPLSGYSFDPRAVIAIVDALQPLGKERALAVVDEYLRVASPYHSPAREGLFVVLRVLFDVPEATGYLPPMLVGAPSPPAPRDPRELPRFPIALVDDVPFLLVQGYLLAGKAQPVEDHVKYFREHGRLRARPLRPPDSPLGLVDRVPLTDRPMVIAEWLALIDTIHREPSDAFGSRFSAGDGWEQRWAHIREDVGRRPSRWDATHDRYVFSDGSTLPEPAAVTYRRELWKTRLGSWPREVSIERKSPTAIAVEVRWAQPTGTHVEMPLLSAEALEPPGPPRKLAAKSSGELSWSLGDETGASSSMTLELPAGRALRLTLADGDEQRRSPSYTP